MLSKIVLLFLVAMAVLAVFGRLRFPVRRKGRTPPAALIAKPRVCKDCGSLVVGQGGCVCAKTRPDGDK